MVVVVWCGIGLGRVCRICVGGFEDLAAADFPAPWGAVSWALGFFTSEFGMGSGAGTPPKPPGRRAHPRGLLACGWQVLVHVCVCDVLSGVACYCEAFTGVWMTAVQDGVVASLSRHCGVQSSLSGD